ncbi:MAG: DUF3575 domain-containing protein [Odoribacteraceae bacterium]|jgi:hypothetical protein|nr:DUF3575 domain-containing protein [Odoribacteraceae bacterium]
MKRYALATMMLAGMLAVTGKVEGQSRYIPVERYVMAEHALPVMAVKTNLLHDALFLAPSLGMEIGLGRRSSLDIAGAYGADNSGEKFFTHALARVEFRGWIRERFHGHFLGAQLLFGKYNVGGRELLSLFNKEFRYDGVAWGASLSYGYHLVIGQRWGIEFSASGGALLFDYDEFAPDAPGELLDDYKKLYSGLTGARVALVFIIN